MSITFKNAPLVELIAEMRWGDGPQAAQQGIPMLMQGMSPYLDQFFMRLSGEVYQLGFRRAERLVPSGFPILPFQPVFRFRKDAVEDNSVLFQAGQGLFSVNALPPYHSWEKISSVVTTGVAALLKARDPDDQSSKFTVTSLRYINAFGPALTRNRSISNFIEDVFGISIGIPIAISKHIKANEKPKPHIQFSFPINESASLAFLVGEGTVNNEQTIIMDMTISSQVPVDADLEKIILTLTHFRDIIHRIFIDLTKPIHHLLQPIEDKSSA